MLPIVWKRELETNICIYLYLQKETGKTKTNKWYVVGGEIGMEWNFWALFKWSSLSIHRVSVPGSQWIPNWEGWSPLHKNGIVTYAHLLIYFKSSLDYLYYLIQCKCYLNNCKYNIVQFSRSVMSDSLRPHEPKLARPPCPSPTPRIHPNPCALSRWCHPNTT